MLRLLRPLSANTWAPVDPLLCAPAGWVGNVLRHAKSYLKQSIEIFQKNVADGDNKVDLLVSQKTVFPDLNRPELNCYATSFTDNPIVADSYVRFIRWCWLYVGRAWLQLFLRLVFSCFSGGQVAKLFQDSSLGNAVNIVVTRLILLMEDQVNKPQ